MITYDLNWMYLPHQHFWRAPNKPKFASQLRQTKTDRVGILSNFMVVSFSPISNSIVSRSNFEWILTFVWTRRRFNRFTYYLQGTGDQTKHKRQLLTTNKTVGPVWLSRRKGKCLSRITFVQTLEYTRTVICLLSIYSVIHHARVCCCKRD